MDRSTVGRALDAMIDEEEGMPFQGLAVQLAQRRCPALIACERKKDLGLDAYAAGATTADGIGIGMMCSITTEIGKIRSDAKKVRLNFPDVRTIYFATPQRVTNLKSSSWKKTIFEEFGFTLIPLTREEIISALMRPENAPLLADHLHISAAPTALDDVEARVRAAVLRVSDSWNRHIRNLPLIELRSGIVSEINQEICGVLTLEGMRSALNENGRIVLEATAGGGKTTTVSQLADRHSEAGGISILVELPEWLDGKASILDFVSETPEFRALSITPEELAALAKRSRFSFFINGWNEINGDQVRAAAKRLRQLEQGFPEAGIVLTTRIFQPSALPNMTLRARLLPLDRFQRNDYLRRRLVDKASVLAGKLDASPILRELTNTPLILNHVVTLHVEGLEIPNTKMGVLREVVSLVERLENHRIALDSSPLSGKASVFLTDLAVFLTARGQTLIGETDAREVVRRALSGLKMDGDPATILRELCDHHLFEPIGNTAPRFRFVHQRFQEFFAAQHLMNQIATLVTADGDAGAKTFALAYLNDPGWAEAVYMVADEIGATLDKADNSDVLKRGVLLVELALTADAIFAAELACSCGPKVWPLVRGLVSKRLAELRASPTAAFQEAGLAAMIATGSADFSGILIPLLSGPDRHTHYETYRTWGDFHVSSLGANWKAVVAAWSEEARIDFVAEMFRFKTPQDEVISFAFSDPSPRVRASAISGLAWFGGFRDKPELLQQIDDTSLREYLSHHALEMVPLSLQARALEIYKERFEEITDPMEKLKTARGMSRLGLQLSTAETKEALAALSKEQVGSLAQRTLEPLIAELRLLDDTEWTSKWVLDRILEGALRADHWIHFVVDVDDKQVGQLLSQLESVDFSTGNNPGVIPILRSKADAGMVRAIFNRLCELTIHIQAAHHRNCAAEANIRRQLEEFLHSLPLEVAVDGVINAVDASINPTEIEVVSKLWGRCGSDDKRFRVDVPDATLEAFRAYVQSSVAPVIMMSDPRGEIKAGLAVVLAQIGVPEDVPRIERLIRADIERMRRNPREMRHTPWYLQAVRQLDKEAAGELSIRLLSEPEYESTAAWSLVRLASTVEVGSTVWMEGWTARDRDYKEIREARAAGASFGFDPDRRKHYAEALTQHIEGLWNLRADPQKKAFAEGHLKGLATPLAALDGHNSLDLILQILELPMERQDSLDGLNRYLTLRSLQFAGVQLPALRTIELLAPVTDKPVGQWQSHSEQEGVIRALSLLPFIDDPVRGIEKISSWYREHKVHYQPLGELIKALGNSEAKEALPLLLEIALDGRNLRNFSDVWVNAVSMLGTPEAHEVLLSFIDSSLPGIPGAHELVSRVVLTSRLADIANSDPSFRYRLFALTHTQLSDSSRKLLAETMAKINDGEALVSALNLVDDRVPGSLPYEIHEQIEQAFVEHKDRGNSAGAYTLSPRSANNLRLKLIKMAAEEGAARETALSLLAQAEKWRLEYGRPQGELRNPVLNLGKQWPPATEEQIRALAVGSNRSGRVLILGKDTGDGLARLRIIQKKLVDLGYDAILIKDQPDERGDSVLQKVLQYATSSRFVVLDNTEASGHLYELPHVSKSAECITAVLQERGRGSTWMVEDAFFRHNHWRKFEFNPEELEVVVEQAAAWSEDFRERFAQHQEVVLPWLAKP
jgi:hypothetical protein